LRILVINETMPTVFGSIEQDGFDVKLHPSRDAPSMHLHSMIKETEMVFLFGNANEKRLFADDVWHLLRNKQVLSVGRSLALSELRDLLPLSKVSICSFYLSPQIDKALAVISSDQTVSDQDRQKVLAALKGCGDVLFLSDSVHGALDRELQKAIESLNENIRSIQKGVAIDDDIFEYAIGWLLYGLGYSVIRGKPLGSAI